MSTGPGIDALASDASLHLLTDDILDHLVDDSLPPCLLHLGRPDADGVTLGIKPLDDIHPSRLLVGFEAPAEWHALGIATRGWAFPMDQRSRADRHRTRVCVVTMVSRTGEVSHRTWVEPDPAISQATRDAMHTAAPTGEQMDLLRRALGLPTEVAPCGSQVYWAIEWLAGIIDVATDPTLTWDDVTAAHPAMALLATTDDGGEIDAEFILTAQSFARVCDWTRLRRLVAERRLAVPEMATTAAMWFDDGSFARYVLNRCPPIDALRDRARGLLDPGLVTRLDAALRSLDVPERAWPDHAPATRPEADDAG